MHDFHLHTNYSFDCDASLESMLEAACAAGLEGVCLTDHVDLCYPPTYEDYAYNYAVYCQDVEQKREEFAGRLAIGRGVELGLQPSVTAQNREFIQGKTYDFMIGSLHAVGKMELYRSDFLKGIEDRQGIANYFEDLAICIQDTDLYDVIGHLDGFRRYLRHLFLGEEEKALMELIREPLEASLRFLIQKGKGIEINTSGMRYGLGAFHPMASVLKLYQELGGEILTIGSDAHFPDHVAFGFREARELCLELGFRYYTLFTERKPEMVKL